MQVKYTKVSRPPVQRVPLIPPPAASSAALDNTRMRSRANDNRFFVFIFPAR
jgi:hypothetical protein